MSDAATVPGVVIVLLSLLAGSGVVVLTFLGYRRTGSKAMAWLSLGFAFLTAGLFMEHVWITYFHQPHVGTVLLHLPGLLGFLAVLVSAWMSRRLDRGKTPQ